MPRYAAPLRLPASPAGAAVASGLTRPPRAVSASLRPRAAMFRAAFTSRSWTVPHAAHVHARTCSGLGPSLAPHALHTCEVGSNRPILRNSRPYSSALYASMAVNAAQPASCTDLANRVRAAPHRQVFHGHRLVLADDLVESLWWKSRRASATFACARAAS